MYCKTMLIIGVDLMLLSMCIPQWTWMYQHVFWYLSYHVYHLYCLHLMIAIASVIV